MGIFIVKIKETMRKIRDKPKDIMETLDISLLQSDFRIAFSARAVLFDVVLTILDDNLRIFHTPVPHSNIAIALRLTTEILLWHRTLD